MAAPLVPEGCGKGPPDEGAQPLPCEGRLSGLTSGWPGYMVPCDQSTWASLERDGRSAPGTMSQWLTHRLAADEAFTPPCQRS
jgi:hypothetical protein